MTGKQLKDIANYAANYNIPISHERTGYFIHVVRIGNRVYINSDEAMAKLENMRPLRKQQA